MPHCQFYKVHACLESVRKVKFDTSKEAYNKDELRDVPEPHWALAFGGYIFDYRDSKKNRNCVALVQRTDNKKWALIPAGVSDNLCEIKYPEELLKRETYEELIICEGQERVDLQEAKLLTTSKIEIVDAKTNRKYTANGELYQAYDNIFLAQAYHVEKEVDGLVFYD